MIRNEKVLNFCHSVNYEIRLSIIVPANNDHQFLLLIFQRYLGPFFHFLVVD